MERGVIQVKGKHLKTAAGWGLFLIIIVELKSCSSLFDARKVSFPQKAICFKGSAQLTQYLYMHKKYR